MQDISLTRDTVSIPSVSYELLTGSQGKSLAYLSVSIFGEETNRLLASHIADITKANVPDIQEAYQQKIYEIPTLTEPYKNLSTVPPDFVVKQMEQFTHNPYNAHSNKSSSRMFQTLGQDYLKQGNFPKAVDSFQKSLQKDPHNPHSHLLLGDTYAQLGERARAEEHYDIYKHIYEMKNYSSMGKGVVQGATDAAHFVKNVLCHPIKTISSFAEGFKDIYREGKENGIWMAALKMASPEAHKICTNPDMPPEEMEDLMNQGFGKIGFNIMLNKGVGKLLTGKSPPPLAAAIIEEKTAASIAERLATAQKAATSTLENSKISTRKVPTKSSISADAATARAAEEALGLPKKAPRFNHPLTRGEAEILRKAYRKAEEFLDNHNKRFISEDLARELIHSQGYRTFPKPKCIPEHYKPMITDRGCGIKYVDPLNPNDTYIRVMPGKPHSEYPCQRNPYVRIAKKEKNLKIKGEVTTDFEAMHISVEEFLQIEEVPFMLQK